MIYLPGNYFSDNTALVTEVNNDERRTISVGQQRDSAVQGKYSD